ncbi:MAG: lipopolysaccharide biosynthesis protein [Burkholderiales bacterium RIFCSPLOWO2_02_FULL_57_36]|nr:MAG: lipopolysaccharide biosynthesis protein [Burkholderiales bacterium RIFCSPLOWO2_02_FULL_57_36]
MQKQYNSIDINNDKDELVSLTALLVPLWRERWIILIITVAAMAFGLSWALLNAQYRSQGFFQFGGAIPMVLEQNSNKNKNKDKDKDKDQEPSPGIALSDFKRYAASYATSERFNDYVQDKKLSATEGVADLYSAFSSRAGISQIIEPVYPFTKLDAKVLMEQPKGSSNNVIGLRVNYTANTSLIAQQMVGLLGRYAMDSIVYLIYSDALRFKHDEIQTKITQLDSTIISRKIQMEEYGRKAADLRKIIAKNPDASGQGARQVLEVTENSAHYLPPTTLLTTTEVQASDANAAILKAKYEQQQNMLLLEYYDRVKSVLDSTKSGETVLRGLEPVKELVFKDKNLQDDVVKAVYNMITIDNQSAITLYLDKSRFIAGPTLPLHSTARPVLTLGVSMILGFLFSILLIFGREWWRKNQTQMLG